jgi:ABC-type lipoprotein export system ATPase subunit
MVFQDFALVTGMSLLDNLTLPFVPEGGAPSPVRRQAGELLTQFGLAEFATSPVERLSAGERQRAGIIRALLVDAPILLLDEPTASLDRANVGRLLDLLVALRKGGRTLVATTHDPRVVDDPRIDGRSHLEDGTLVT